MTRLRGSRVVVTGAARGLGRRLATRLAARGAEPVLWDISQDAMAATADAIASNLGRRPVTVACDVSDPEQVRAAAERTFAEAGDVHVVINNAGVVAGAPLLELDDDAIARVFAVNALAVLHVTRAMLPPMVARGAGHVVTIASAAGLLGVPRLVDYCASKHAAVGFDHALRLELRDRAPGVRTTVVCPYLIDTGMFDGMKTRFEAMLPVLKEDDVAARVLTAIERDETKLILPGALRLIPLLHLLPTRVMDAITDLFGVHRAMDRFHGHGDPPG